MNDGRDSWDFESMVTTIEVATSGIHDKLREVESFYEDCGVVVSTKIDDVIDLACRGFEIKHENAKLSERNTPWWPNLWRSVVPED